MPIISNYLANHFLHIHGGKKEVWYHCNVANSLRLINLPCQIIKQLIPLGYSPMKQNEGTPHRSQLGRLISAEYHPCGPRLVGRRPLSHQRIIRVFIYIFVPRKWAHPPKTFHIPFRFIFIITGVDVIDLSCKSCVVIPPQSSTLQLPLGFLVTSETKKGPLLNFRVLKN